MSTVENVGSLAFVVGLFGLPFGIGLWFGLGAGVTLACVELIVVGFFVGYDAYVARQKAAK